MKKTLYLTIFFLFLITRWSYSQTGCYCQNAVAIQTIQNWTTLTHTCTSGLNNWFSFTPAENGILEICNEGGFINLWDNCSNKLYPTLTGTCDLNACQNPGELRELPVVAGNTVYLEIGYSACGSKANVRFTPNVSVCDVGGILVYRSDEFTRTMKATDLAPSLVRKDDCVVDAYDGDVPTPLLANVFIFYNDGKETIDINFTNGGNPDTKAFVFSCFCEPGTSCQQVCLGEVDKSFDGTNADPGFYYLIILSSGQNEFWFDITPPGPCQLNQTEISNNTSFQKTLAGESNQYSTIGSGDELAYENCYNGSGNYDGNDIVFKFIIEQPSIVTIELEAVEPMGMFLFDFICGESCIAFAENSPAGGSASLDSLLLSPGVYNIIVDKVSPGGSQIFSLDISSDIDTDFFTNTFISNDDPPPGNCPTNSSSLHNLGIENTAFNFTPNELISLLYKDENGAFRTNDNMSRFWNGAQTMTFSLPIDQNGDAPKCSYIEDDSLMIYLINPDNYGFTTVQYNPINPPGVTASGTYSSGGNSIVNTIERKEVSTFLISSSFRRVIPDANEFFIQITSNKSWEIDMPADVDWLSITPTGATGSKIIRVSVDANADMEERDAGLVFSTQESRVPRFRHMLIEQLGKRDSVVAATTLDLSPYVELFPNPNSGKFSLAFDLPKEHEVEVEILDILGRTVYQRSEEKVIHKTVELNLSDYAEGVYLVRIRLGDKLVIRRVVYEK